MINATRLVVQSIGVALLATVLASAISPEIQALQNQFQEKQVASGKAFGLCETPPISNNGPTLIGSGTGQLAPAAVQPPGASQPPVALQPPATAQIPGSSIIERACRENVAGFENAYKVTFFAALIALILGSMLPGWPGEWGGRQDRGHTRFSPLKIPFRDPFHD